MIIEPGKIKIHLKDVIKKNKKYPSVNEDGNNLLAYEEIVS